MVHRRRPGDRLHSRHERSFTRDTGRPHGPPFLPGVQSARTQVGLVAAPPHSEIDD